ncbi:hypothetical protein GF356_08905 [candidate division GN15 bacterium]|nr:hypothetical protein [candidate division GN15 bacterium]
MRKSIDIVRWLDSFHLADGAISTELFRFGCPHAESPEQWGLDHRDTLIQVHHDYLSAGAEMLLAATFGANLFNPLAEFDDTTLAEALHVLVALARQAAGERIPVLASVGPLALFSSSDPGPVELGKQYRHHFEILKETECDLIALETFTSLREAEIALEQAAILDMPCVITFAAGEDGSLEDGESLETWVSRIARTSALGLGCNCSPDITQATEVASALSEISDLPVIMRPNSGQPDENGQFPISADTFAEMAFALYDAGVDLLGGCCGTTADHIRKTARLLGDSQSDEDGPE